MSKETEIEKARRMAADYMIDENRRAGGRDNWEPETIGEVASGARDTSPVVRIMLFAIERLNDEGAK